MPVVIRKGSRVISGECLHVPQLDMSLGLGARLIVSISDGRTDGVTFSGYSWPVHAAEIEK